MSMILMVAAAMSVATPQERAELDYAPGELAYGALVSGDLRLAERQLEASRAAHVNDPAWLLNYGQFLARSGRVTEASAVFRRVAAAPDSEIVLSSGEVTSSRDASRRALRGLSARTLSAR